MKLNKQKTVNPILSKLSFLFRQFLTVILFIGSSHAEAGRIEIEANDSDHVWRSSGIIQLYYHDNNSTAYLKSSSPNGGWPNSGEWIWLQFPANVLNAFLPGNVIYRVSLRLWPYQISSDTARFYISALDRDGWEGTAVRSILPKDVAGDIQDEYSYGYFHTADIGSYLSGPSEWILNDEAIDYVYGYISCIDSRVLLGLWTYKEKLWFYNHTSTDKKPTLIIDYFGAPIGVAASDDHEYGVDVEWTDLDGPTSYEIWRSTSANSGSATKIGTETSSPFSDDTAVPGTRYYYWVKARNAHGATGFSTSDSGMRRLLGVGISATDGTFSDKVQITWASSTGATGYEI